MIDMDPQCCDYVILLFDCTIVVPIQTSLGGILVTNLGKLPRHVHLIAVPGGDYERAHPALVMNLNLRRLGCAGRNTLDLSPPR